MLRLQHALSSTVPCRLIPGDSSSRPSMKLWTWIALVAFVLPLIASAQATPSDAMALEQQGKLAEATKAWRAVTAQNPRDAAAFASLGVVLSKQQKYEDAIVAYRKAL